MADALKEAVELLESYADDGAKIEFDAGGYLAPHAKDALTTILAALSAATERAEILQQAVHDRCAERDAALERERVIPPEQYEKVVQSLRQRLHKHFHKWVTHRTATSIVNEVARALTPETPHAE